MKTARNVQRAHSTVDGFGLGDEDENPASASSSYHQQRRGAKATSFAGGSKDAAADGGGARGSGFFPEIEDVGSSLDNI